MEGQEHLWVLSLVGGGKFPVDLFFFLPQIETCGHTKLRVLGNLFLILSSQAAKNSAAVSPI